jgi:NADH-quinone oxidoreductase subunit E
VVLKENEIKEIDRELSRSRDNRAGCIEALNIIQKHRGWVSDEAIRDISSHLNMTPDELDSVATFYSLIFRKPVGRHVILLCDSVVCWMMGEEDLKKRLFDKLGIGMGETTGDGRFTLIPNACLGICHHAPAMMIDDDIHSDLTAEKLDGILDKYQ